MSGSPLQAAQDARSAGYSHVLTMGGTIALDAWTPYGKQQSEPFFADKPKPTE